MGYKVFNIIRAIFLTVVISQSVYAEQAVQFSKIEYKDDAIANKMLISLHHSIFEINREQKYIIATLSAQEHDLLSHHNVSISHAIQWQKKFEQNLGLKQSKISSVIAKTSIPGFACYPTVEDTYEQAQTLAERHPDLASWFDIGDSWMKANDQGGYDLMVMKITNTSMNKEKPVLFVHSSMHAREYTPAALNLDFAQWLLTGYETNAEARWIVDNREVHLLFHMNPDGRKIAEQQVFQRKNTNQNHCPDSTVGVDLNSNFSFSWYSTPNGSSGNACGETYRGVAPESEPETVAVSNYIRTLFSDERGLDINDAAPNDKSGLHLDIHSYGELILWPWGDTNQAPPNNTGLVALGNKLAWFNGYTPQQSIGLYATDGTSDDVSYGELGVAAITFELGNSFFESCSAYEQTIKPDNLKALIYAAKVAQAPYQLSQGPDIESIRLNQSVTAVTVTQGTPVTLEVSGTSNQTRLSGVSTNISSLEYVLDGDFSSTDTIISLSATSVADGGKLTSVSTLDTSALALGKHVLSIRAKDGQGNAGVASSILLVIGENNSPIATFNAVCQDLDCTFDAAESSDADGEITNYQWVFPNGSQQEGISTAFSFSSAGDKEVTLNITDNSGLTASTSKLVNVKNIEVITVTPETSSSSSGGTLLWLLLLLFPNLLFRLKKFK